MLAAISALAAILHAGALTFEIIRHAGVAYLLWMACATLRDTGALQIDDSLPPRRAAEVIRAAVLMNILNPSLR